MIHVETLGGLRVSRDGERIRGFSARRQRAALLVYLAVEREASRDQLLGLLWPERDPDRARALLSQTLYELRHDLQDDAWMESQGQMVVATTALTTDISDFRELVEEELGKLKKQAGPVKVLVIDPFTIIAEPGTAEPQFGLFVWRFETQIDLL